MANAAAPAPAPSHPPPPQAYANGHGHGTSVSAAMGGALGASIALQHLPGKGPAAAAAQHYAQHVRNVEAAAADAAAAQEEDFIGEDDEAEVCVWWGGDGALRRGVLASVHRSPRQPCLFSLASPRTANKCNVAKRCCW